MKYFSIEELVSHEILEAIGEKAAWFLIDPVIQTNLDALREAYGDGIFVNGMFGGYHFNNSGVRTVNCTIGAKYSHHKPIYGDDQAFDLKCDDQYKLRDIIEERNEEFLIYRAEEWSCTPTWSHIEFSTKHKSEGLTLFNP